MRVAADAFNVPYLTMQARLRGCNPRSYGHESQQNLSSAEEDTLVRWITRLTRTGYPATLHLVKEMAEEVRSGRVQLGHTPPSNPRPIGHTWIQRFKTRHPELGSIWTCQIDSARFYATNYAGVQKWFDAVTELFVENQYPLERVYNIDESGFAVGLS